MKSLALLGLFVLAACVPAALPSDGETISWERAVALLHDGHVTMLMQIHAWTSI